MDKEMLELLKEMSSEIKEIKIQVRENTQILKALEYSGEINKAEHDKLIMDIVNIKGNVEAIRKDVSNVEVITASNWQDIAKLKAIK